METERPKEIATLDGLVSKLKDKGYKPRIDLEDSEKTVFVKTKTTEYKFYFDSQGKMSGYDFYGFKGHFAPYAPYSRLRAIEKWLDLRIECRPPTDGYSISSDGEITFSRARII